MTLVRDSLELASLASTHSHVDGASDDASSARSSTPRRLSSSSDSAASPSRPTRDRSYSVSSAFDFAPVPFNLSTSGPAGYTAVGAPTTRTTGGGLGGLERNKTLTLWKGGLSLVVGLVIGSGIFSSPAQVNINAGSPAASLVVWLIAGTLAWTGAASYAELGGAIPLSGGAQIYLGKIYGEWAGFVFTWCAVTVLKPGSAAIVGIIFGEYVMRAFVGPDAMSAGAWMDKLVAVAGILASTLR